MAEKNRKSSQYAACIAVLLVVLLAAAGVIWAMYKKTDVLKTEEAQKVLEELKDDTVTGLFLSMYPIDHYDTSDFWDYRGINTTFYTETLKNGKDMLRLLQACFNTQQSLEAVYIGVKMQEQETGWEEKLLALVQENPQIRFHLIIEYTYIEELAKLSQEEQETLFAWYEDMAEWFTPTQECQNMIMFLPQAETWLTGNPANYTQDGLPNREVTRYALMQMTCEDYYALDVSNVDEKIARIRALLEEKEHVPKIDSEYTFVFFGDSVIGNYRDSMSVPGVLSGIGQVTAINCGYGGLSAAKMSETSYGIVDMTEAFLEGRYEMFEDDKAIKTGIPEFYERKSEIQEDKLVFFFSLGINDYLSGNPLEAFETGIKDAVSGLREVYPQSEVVLMTPNFVAYYDGGTEAINGYTMEQLTDRVIQLSEELHVKCIDIYHEAIFFSDDWERYIPDLVHPSELGRYEIGKLVCASLAQWYPAASEG